MKNILLSTAYFILLTGISAAQPNRLANETYQAIAESHIDGNVPAEADFNRILVRDLQLYFSKQFGKGISVSYELLRQGATQTGISYPKFYLWARIEDGGKRLDEGAVRVAAIERTQFEVTDFLSKSQIQSTPGRVSQIFPRLLEAKIIERTKN